MSTEQQNVPEMELLAGIVEHMSDAFMVIDTQWRFTYFNHRALLSLGTDRESALGRNVFDLFPQFVGTEWERQCRRAMEERVPAEFELYYPPVSTWTEVRVYPAPVGIALYYRDVTARRRGELALQYRTTAIDGINRILRAALDASDEADLGQICLEVAETVTGSPFGFISELGIDGLLHDVAVSNPGWDVCSVLRESHRRLRDPSRVAGLHGRVIKQGASFFTNDPSQHPDRVGLPKGHPPLTAFLGTPLKEGGRTFGLIGVGNRDGGYDEDTAALLELVAPAIVEAFQRLRSEQRQRRRAQFDRALNEVNTAAHSSLDNRTILETAFEEISRSTELNAVAVHVRTDEGWSFAFSHGLPEDLARLCLSDEQAPMSMLVLGSREPIVMTDTATDPRANRPLVERFDIRSLVGFPLVVRGQPFGVLFAGSIGVPRPITEAEVDFLEGVTAALSLALENARLYEAEHRIAETLQQALLSLPERVEGISFAHAYRSAAEAARVGGDFYDIFETEGGRIGVVIGDVAGKGLEAAALTSLLRNAIRANASVRGYTVADVMSMTSELVYKVTGPETFATVFFGSLDCSTGQLAYSNAGHPTMGIIQQDGTVRHLPSNSPIVGAFQEAEYSWSETTLDKGELLLLYTDGIIEARSSDDMYGEQRLFTLASRVGAGDPATVVRAVVDDLLAFVTGGLTDDAAIMAVGLLGSDAVVPVHQEVSIP